MLSIYAKLLDKVVTPNMEKKCHLGRRITKDRRDIDIERRNHAAGIVDPRYSDRRHPKDSRRRHRIDDRRQKWFRINSFQSRHFSWTPEEEE